MSKVSIIVPVYNVEKYLPECLDSLVNQTYKNIEIILANDGSKDSTGNICQRYANVDERIIYVNKENTGVSDTRNICLEKASGEYVLFVDGDDWIDLDCIEILMKNIEDNDLIQFNMIKEMKNGELVIKDIAFEGVIEKKEQLIENVIIPDKFKGGIGESRAVCSKFYRKRFIENIKFDSEMKFYEDGHFFLNLWRNDMKCKIINNPMYHYRYNPTSCTTSYRDNVEKETICVFNKLRKTLNQLNRNDLLDYVKLDMICINLNNLCRKKSFSYKEIKSICKIAEYQWNVQKISLFKQFVAKKRKFLLLLLKLKLYLGVYLVYRIKK